MPCDSRAIGKWKKALFILEMPKIKKKNSNHWWLHQWFIEKRITYTRIAYIQKLNRNKHFGLLQNTVLCPAKRICENKNMYLKVRIVRESCSPLKAVPFSRERESFFTSSYVGIYVCSFSLHVDTLQRRSVFPSVVYIRIAAPQRKFLMYEMQTLWMGKWLRDFRPQMSYEKRIVDICSMRVLFWKCLWTTPDFYDVAIDCLIVWAFPSSFFVC